MDNNTEQQLINDEVDNAEFERWYWDRGMYIKDDKTAREWLIDAGNELLERDSVHPVLRTFLGQALRNAGLCEDNKAAIDSLVNTLGLGNQKERTKFDEQKFNKFLQERRAGVGKGALSKKYNIGRDEVKNLLAPVETKERELLDRRISNTVGHILLMLDEKDRGEFTLGEVKEYLRANLMPQFRLAKHKIEDHINKAIEFANSENLILIPDEYEGDKANVFRNI